MKSSFDLKHDIGKITPENTDDLWVLSEIIRPGIIVKARTKRSVEVKRGGEKEKVGKRYVALTIHVEKVELSERLRLGGKILEGPEDISKRHHTIEVTPGTFLTVQKKWKSWEVNKIRAARKKVEPIIACVLDDSECDFYMLKDRPKHLVHIPGGTLGKKTGKSKKPEYYGKVLSQLKKCDTRKIIIAGPGFVKEEIRNLVKVKDKDVFEKLIMDSLSHTGEVGLQELLNRGVLEKIVSDSRITEEVITLEKLFVGMATDGKVVYGKDETKNALESGAVEVLLVSDKKVREFENLLDKAEKERSKIMIISSSHNSGDRFFRLGGIAAFLRYKI